MTVPVMPIGVEQAPRLACVWVLVDARPRDANWR